MEENYFVDLAAAFVRGRLGGTDTGAAAIRRGLEAGLKLHKFKRSAQLPRVRRVIGALRGLGPSFLLDVGSGRGTFLWPLLDSLPDVAVVALEHDPLRAADLGAVRLGGIARLHAVRADATLLPFRDHVFDCVTLLEVLEHLERPVSAAAEALRVARHVVIASVPTHEDDNPEHIHLFDQDQLRALFGGARRVTFDYVLNHTVCVAMK